MPSIAPGARLSDSFWPADRSEPLLETTLGDLLRHRVDLVLAGATALADEAAATPKRTRKRA